VTVNTAHICCLPGLLSCHDEAVARRSVGIPRRNLIEVVSARRRRPLAFSFAPTDRPQIVAHRGSSTEEAEHTLAAYRRALHDGADALECDVRLTADGHLVCVHDRRIDRTSNGKGVVSALRLEDMERMDFASWKTGWRELDEQAYGIDERPGRVLTLERLLDTVRDYDRPVELAIETKHPTRYAGLVERRLVELLDRYGWARPRRGRPSPVRVMSYSSMSLRRVLELAPGLPTVYLMDRVPLRYRDGTLPVGASVSCVDMGVIRQHPEYVRKVHQHGHEVHVFTVNLRADVQRCLAAHVDAIITDVPMLVRMVTER
jgi:glycerophosphoryl diester phosphodiesterase